MKIQSKKIEFNKSLRGYEVTEVDSFLQDIANKYNALLEENKKLKENIKHFQEKEDIIQHTLISAQDVAKNIKLNAEKESIRIKKEAEKFATTLINDTELEVKSYVDSIYTYYYNYERNLRKTLKSFYTLSEKHIGNLENEFMKSIKDEIINFEKDLNEFATLDRTENAT